MAALSHNKTLCYYADPPACLSHMASIAGTVAFSISALVFSVVMIWVSHVSYRGRKQMHPCGNCKRHPRGVWAEIRICNRCCGYSATMWEWIRLVYRTAVFLLCTIVLAYQASFTGPLLFCAYTVWNFSILIVTFAIGIITSILEIVVHKRRQRDEKRIALLAPQHQPSGITCLPSIRRVHHVLVEVELATTALIALIVWTLLYPESHDQALLRMPSLLEHGINIAFMAVEFCLRGVHIRLPHIWVLLVLPIVYSFFHAGFWWFTGHNLYPFMDLTSPYAPLWAIGICVVHALFYVLLWGVSSVWFYLSHRNEPDVYTDGYTDG